MQPKQVIGPTIFHFELSEGMDHQFDFVYADSSTLLPKDLTGWHADLYMTYSPGHPQILVSLSTRYSALGGSISLGSAGEVSIHLFGQLTSGLNWDEGVYDLVLTSPQGNRVKLLRGKVNVYNTVSFPTIGSNPIPTEALILTVGQTTLPNGLDLWGYMNPLKMGVGGGLLFTGNLRPTITTIPIAAEVVELSYSGGRLQLTFLGNIPDGTFSSLTIGTFTVSMTTGRVFSDTAANGLGLTFWSWTGYNNPFAGMEGTNVAIQLS